MATHPPPPPEEDPAAPRPARQPVEPDLGPAPAPLEPEELPGTPAAPI